MTSTPRSRLKINHLAEFGAELEPRLPPENGRATNDLFCLCEGEVEAFPLLSREDEIALAKKMEQTEEAREKLGENNLAPSSQARLEAKVKEGEQAEREFIESNLRLVIYWAETYQGQGLGLLDLIQEGNVGLIRAIHRFDYREGCRFSTYGTWWIRQAIGRAIAEKTRTIRLPVHTHERIRRLTKLKRGLVQKLGREPTVRELTLQSNLLTPHERGAIHSALDNNGALPPGLKDRLEDAEEKVRRVLRVSKEPVSLEMPIDAEGGRRLYEFIEDDRLEGPVTAFECQALREHVESYLEVLSDGEYRVIEMRFGLHHLVSHTLQEIGDEFDLTRERIRQIEEDALRKLKRPARARGLGYRLG